MSEVNEAGTRDRPWMMRTYAGHSSASASNALFRTNLAKGQTGLSVAFDLPTQTGYDPDSPMAAGEVGKVGVPIAHLGDMRTLFRDIPLDQMNTSMTINATAMWLFALYIAVAEEQGVEPAQLQGTTQNDIIKEYLSRGTYVFPPDPSLRLITDMIVYSVTDVPQWNPINICSYHLQEAGATPTQEIAYAMATAIEVLDRVRDTGRVPGGDFGSVVSRMSFFVNAGVRFVEEMCKMRTFVELWDSITKERYGVEDPKQRRFRYGVQVNSLGLTEAQPENNVYRIMLEMLAVTLSRDARARAVQLPAWNEALGLPRPWDQQWSLRMQQVLAFETDLLEYDDLFAGSPVVEAKVADMESEAREELLDGSGRHRRFGLGAATGSIPRVTAELGFDGRGATSDGRGATSASEEPRDPATAAATTTAPVALPAQRSRVPFVAGGLAVVALALTGLALATGRGTEPVGVAAVLLTVLLAFVALRARRTASHVTIDDHGVVDIRSGETHHRFDVYDASTDLEMVGVPGQRGWEVRFKRRALPPVVVTAAMVDAEAFSRELRRWRPGL